MLLSGQRRANALIEHGIGVIEGFKRELLLALEMVVDAAPLQAGFLHNLCERRAKVALLVEEQSQSSLIIRPNGLFLR